MLTGQYPYEVVGSTLEVLQNIQKTEPTRPRTIIRKFDSDLEAILLTALAKDPAERYQSAAELQSDIESWLSGRPIRVKSISTVYLLRKIIARHRFTSTVAALLLLIILAFGYISFDLYLTAKAAQQQTEDRATALTAETARRVALSRPFVFHFFLQAWRQGRNQQASFVGTFLSEGCKEHKAVMFLFDSRPLIEKEADIRRALSGDDSWFAEFVIGENHLRNGNRQQALEAFNRSNDAVEQTSQSNDLGIDGFLIELVKTRLKELKAADKQTEKNEMPKAMH
jgi:serine/threonine protein kinase